MPFNLKSFDAAIDIYNEAGHDDSVNNNDSLISFGHFTTNENIATENDDDNEPYSDVGSVLDIFDLDSSKLEDNTSSHNETIKKFPSTIKEMEDNFDDSSDKISLFDTLNSLKKDKGWEGKVQEFAKKSINDNTLTENEQIFQDYVAHVTNFGVKSLPLTMTNEIKENISNFVKNRLNPITEFYKEALLQAGEKIMQPIKEIRYQTDYDKPSSAKTIYCNLTKDTQDKMGQVKPNISNLSTSTIAGQGMYDEEDFLTILNHDVKMSLIGDPDYNSDEESGIMSIDDEIILVSKLEREAERQIRIQNDFREALNPNIGLELNGMYSDHKHVMDSIVRLRSDAIEIYNDSIVANHDKTLPPPEVLTYKYKGRIYKLVTLFQWMYSDDNTQLPSEHREKRVNKIQKFYLHLPPPAMLPMRKRLFNVMEIPASCSPQKMRKPSFNLTINGVKIGKSSSSKKTRGNLNTSEIPGTTSVKDLSHDAVIDKDNDDLGNSKTI